MNNRSKIILTIGLAVSLHMGLYPTTDIAMSATAPVITTQPAITTEISTPVRLATDASGNIYATDHHAGGILKYNSAGTLVQKIVTSKSGGGVAIAQDGTPNVRLLVTQGNYVAVINPSDGVELSRFGAFKYANGIAVDSSNNIYVTDTLDNKLYKFNSSYVQQAPVAAITVPGIVSARPAGIAYDKFNNRIAIANTLAGAIQFYNPATMTLLETVGARNINEYDYVPPVYPSTPEFTYPQGVSFEYEYNTAVPPVIIGVKRIYVAETFQANIQILDGVAPYDRIADVGGYGFVNGKLYVPSDVLIDQKNPANKRILVANGAGTLAVYSISDTQGFNLTLITAGDGTINGGTVETSCGANTNCSSTLAANTQVNLTATASVNTTFTGWTTGPCIGSTANTCSFILAADQIVTATFAASQIKPFRVNGSYYDNLQAAYNAATTGSTIYIMGGPQLANTTGGFTANDPTKTVTLKGGYDTQFSEPANGVNTVITGRINVQAGKVIMNNVRVRL